MIYARFLQGNISFTGKFKAERSGRACSLVREERGSLIWRCDVALSNTAERNLFLFRVALLCCSGCPVSNKLMPYILHAQIQSSETAQSHCSKEKVLIICTKSLLSTSNTVHVYPAKPRKGAALLQENNLSELVSLFLFLHPKSLS